MYIYGKWMHMCEHEACYNQYAKSLKMCLFIYLLFIHLLLFIFFLGGEKKITSVCNNHIIPLFYG